VLDTLGQLVNKSLVVVQQHGDESRYRLLETIRQYGRDKLAAAGESAAVHERHARYYVRLAAEYEPHYFGPDLAQWLGKFEPDAGNFGAAHEWLLECDPLSALRLASATAFALQRLGRFIECEQHLSDASARVRQLPPPEPVERRAALALGLAYLSMNLIARGETQRGRDTAREAAEMARAIDERKILAFALGCLSICDMLLGDYDRGEVEAREAAELSRAVGLSRDAGSFWGMTGALSAQAAARAMRGDDPAAAALSREAMRSAEAWDSPWAMGMTAMSAARVADMAGDLPAARALIERAKGDLDRAGDVHFSHVMTANLGHYLRRAGQRAEARAMYRQSLKWFQEFGNRGAVAHHFECFGMLALDEGVPERAARLFGAADHLRAQVHASLTAFERAEYDAAQARLHAALEPEALERAWNEGRALGMEQAVALALKDSDD
jgi:tetratricopeptide (TPR) repeat protein